MTTTPTNTRSQGGEETLLPCPFCGGSASLARCGFGTARVTCMDCGSEGEYCQSHADAIAAWNTRALAAPASAQEVQADSLISESEAAASGERLAWLRETLDTPEKRREWRAANPTPSAAVQQEALHTFLDAAAGEGFVLNGVDAADLYIALFPERHAARCAICTCKPGLASEQTCERHAEENRRAALASAQPKTGERSE